MSKIKVGATLPDFELQDENGDLHRLSELQGDDLMVLSPDGEHLGTLGLPETPHNLAWGGDGHDLYITALTSVYRLRLETKGATL